MSFDSSPLLSVCTGERSPQHSHGYGADPALGGSMPPGTGTCMQRGMSGRSRQHVSKGSAVAAEAINLVTLMGEGCRNWVLERGSPTRSPSCLP